MSLTGTANSINCIVWLIIVANALWMFAFTIEWAFIICISNRNQQKNEIHTNSTSILELKKITKIFANKTSEKSK